MSRCSSTRPQGAASGAESPVPCQRPTCRNRQVQADVEVPVAGANATSVGPRVVLLQPCHRHREGALLGDVLERHAPCVAPRGVTSCRNDGVANSAPCYFAPVFSVVFVGCRDGVEALMGERSSNLTRQKPGSVQGARNWVFQGKKETEVVGYSDTARSLPGENQHRSFKSRARL